MTFLESLKFSAWLITVFTGVVIGLAAWGTIAHWIINSLTLWLSIPLVLLLLVFTTATGSWLFSRGK